MKSASTVVPKKASKLGEVRVLRREDVTEDLLKIWIERPPEYTFKAGQYCTIGIDGVERAYSIVSAPHEESLELFVELVPLPDGVLTPRIWELKIGDALTIRPRAKGLFVFDPGMPNQLLVSTVTGVVPYVSFIRDYIHRGLEGHRFYVLQGASYVDEFTYDDELQDIADRRPELVAYVPTVSRPGEQRNNGWAGDEGRCNLIAERQIERFGLTPEDTFVYACGHPGMIEDVKDRLIPKGFTVKEERFWKQD